MPKGKEKIIKKQKPAKKQKFLVVKKQKVKKQKLKAKITAKKIVSVKTKNKVLKNQKRKVKNIHNRPKLSVVKKKNKLKPKKKEKKVTVKKKSKLKAKKRVVKPVVAKKKAPKAKAKEIVKKVKPQKLEKPVGEFAAESLFKARIKVIGIGGGGGSIVSEIGRSLSKATFVIADTDIRALKKKTGIKYLWFGQEETHGLGTGVNVELAKEVALKAKDKISENFKDQDIIIFIASLGGGLGSGATQVFAEVAREFGGISVGIFTMPFRFEGKNKQRIALSALKSLRQSLNVSLVIPNERIFKIIDADTPITQAFSTVNKSLIESLESLIDLIYSPGIINIDFADLRTILKGRGNSAFLNTVEESGKNRAEKICEKILTNPLLQNGGFPAEKILFNISGAENLSMFEVEKISSHISSTNPKSKIIFGISKDAKLKNKIKTTILMTGGGDQKSEDVIPVVTTEKVKVAKPDKSPKEHFDGPVTIPPKVDLVGKEAKKEKKIKPKKPAKIKSKGKIKENKLPKEKSISYIPVFEKPTASSAIESRKISLPVLPEISKKNVRRSGLEIKKAEEQEEKKRIDQEREWEIPAFLRRVKYKS